ncbi:MAG: hypothetical protein N3A58_09055 [Spirochaetes bacterium]|nr:hypothetical protein [Spirochaetota bacterium]
MINYVLGDLRKDIKKIFIPKYLRFLLIKIFILFVSIIIFYFKQYFNTNFIILLYIFNFYIFLLTFTSYITGFIEQSEYNRIDVSVLLSNLNKSNDIAICIIIKYSLLFFGFFLLNNLLKLLKFNIIENNFFLIFPQTIKLLKSGNFVPFFYLLGINIVLILYPLYSILFNFCNFFIIDRDEIAKNALSFSISKCYKDYVKIFILNLPFILFIYLLLILGGYITYIFRNIKILSILYFFIFSILVVLAIHIKTLLNYNIYVLIKNS